MADVLEKMDLIFIDLKHMDNAKHQYFTGQGNELILENIKKIGSLGVPVVVRVPVIEIVNATEENIRQTAKYVHENIPNPKMELLPYHSFGEEKYEKLGLEMPSEDFKASSREQMKKLESLVEAEGVNIVHYR